MSNVIIWKLQDSPDSYNDWYDFLNWMDPASTREVSSWDDSYYTKTIYKAYEVDNEKELTYILLRWNVTNKGNYDKWKEEKRKIEYSIYDEQAIVWINTND